MCGTFSPVEKTYVWCLKMKFMARESLCTRKVSPYGYRYYINIPTGLCMQPSTLLKARLKHQKRSRPLPDWKHWCHFFQNKNDFLFEVTTNPRLLKVWPTFKRKDGCQTSWFFDRRLRWGSGWPLEKWHMSKTSGSSRNYFVPTTGRHNSSCRTLRRGSRFRTCRQ